MCHSDQTESIRLWDLLEKTLFSQFHDSVNSASWLAKCSMSVACRSDLHRIAVDWPAFWLTCCKVKDVVIFVRATTMKQVDVKNPSRPLTFSSKLPYHHRAPIFEFSNRICATHHAQSLSGWTVTFYLQSLFITLHTWIVNMFLR